MKQVNFAIIGCGSISKTHVKALTQISQARLAAACDLDIGKAEETVKDSGGKAYNHYEELLASPDVDAVIILTASGMHADMGIKAAKAKKHVIVEKPLDINVEKARKLIHACDENHVTLSCIFQHRFDTDTLKLKKAIEDGRLGRLDSGCCHTKWFRGQEYYDEVAWRGTKALDGGGALMNQGIHQLDLFQHLMGEVDEVFSYCATRAHERIDVEDLCMATLRFKNGALGILESSTVAYPGFYTRIDICGNDGSVILQNNTVQEWKLRDGEEYAGVKTELPHKLQLEEIAQAILEGHDSSVSGREALKSLLIADAIYRSAQSGKPEQVLYEERES